MNDLPTLPDPAVSSAKASEIPPAPPSSQPEQSLLETLQQPQVLLAGIAMLLIMLAAQTWSSHARVNKLREEMAMRLQKGDAINADTGTLVRNVQESTKELQTKVALLESKQQEAQSQQLALEQLYQDLSKNRDEWALTEIEQVLSTASQQLQLAGNVPGALIALQNADRSLSRSDKPQFITIRRAIARDTDKLKALPSVDSVGVALRLDNAIAQIDTLPMLSDEKPTLPAPAEKKARPAKVAHDKQGKPVKIEEPVTNPWLQSLQDGWTGWSTEMWTDVRQLIRVRNVDTPEALMMSPTQAYFMRENLKLRLLNARMALLSRNEGAFRADLIAAQEALNKYFDTRARSTQTVQALLRQVQSSNLAIEMPTLSDSLNAVRNYKAKP
ncbi:MULTISPECIES: uroporphyrinogen-III C-methyltransferase [unclassified Duganella]|uniref:uroporphyrinogen-III C-methyltransferase n=1 Tax=unclassified Duganella TaxID=2636909 RepID=UPI0008823DF8|nr:MULTISPECIES: uroporphyrinogen-III C-methyltransferase [unclassified Duganella]SDH52989.1 uroporphyrinogen III methyltransferase / synthase [Duganella sp. OV458]SDK69729.1 uroporphyrin-3 C-methyltransferase/uroporphyrinogen III methyltransferase / synthase [Duganella sp. OV510]